MVKVTQIDCQVVADSRGQQTVEVRLSSLDLTAKASVPSGKSKGSFEAASVTPEQAVVNIQNITEEITQQEFRGLGEFDQFLINRKRELGANTTLALSIAFVRLQAKITNQPLYQLISQIAGTTASFPKLFVNLVNGGLHAPANLNPLPFQEYIIIPQLSSPEESLNLAFSFIEILKDTLKKFGQEFNLGDEGGAVVSGDDPQLGLEILEKTRVKGNFGDRVKFGLDVAATTLWNSEKNIYHFKDQAVTVLNLQENYQSIIDQYPLLSIEDPFNEENWAEWTNFKKIVVDGVWVVGDDLTVTNIERMNKANERDAVNAVIIKPNQIGTVTETIEAVKLAKNLGWKVIVSHRSSETEDAFIADLAYGVGADGLKSGSPLQKERLVKYQRLIEIEKSL